MVTRCRQMSEHIFRKFCHMNVLEDHSDLRCSQDTINMSTSHPQGTVDSYFVKENPIDLTDNAKACLKEVSTILDKSGLKVREKEGEVSTRSCNSSSGSSLTHTDLDKSTLICDRSKTDFVTNRNKAGSRSGKPVLINSKTLILKRSYSCDFNLHMLRKLNAERNINPNFKFSLVNPLPVNKMSCVTDLERKVQLVPNLPVPTDDMETDSSSPILHRQKERSHSEIIENVLKMTSQESSPSIGDFIPQLKRRSISNTHSDILITKRPKSSNQPLLSVISSMHEQWEKKNTEDTLFGDFLAVELKHVHDFPTKQDLKAKIMNTIFIAQSIDNYENTLTGKSNIGLQKDESVCITASQTMTLSEVTTSEKTD